MSFNVRVDTPRDEGQSWTWRIPSVKAVWQRANADVVGIQEGLPHQVQDLSEWFPRYAWVGSGREEDGGGESVAIFYRRDRLELIDYGNFWLSDTPQVRGSRSFGNRLPRLATWARLQDQSGHIWFILNTHLDHESVQARDKGAAQIRDFLSKAVRSETRLVTGDFNALPESKSVQTLVADESLVDVFAEAKQDEGTYHGYTGSAQGRIDYILADSIVRLQKVEIMRDCPNGLWPSDHFPIYADVTLPYNC